MDVIRTVVFCFLAAFSVTTARPETEDGVTNIALHKDITLSDVSKHESKLAVDGTTDQNMAEGSCIHIETKDDIWWQVDLGDVYTIFDIKVVPTEDFHDTIVKKKEDCYKALWSYEGQTNTTKSGKQCQRWDLQTPYRHDFQPQKYWYRGENFLTENYCRAPRPEDVMPWCYTTDRTMRWELCDILVDGCEYVHSSAIYLKTGTDVNNLVNTDYTEVNDELQRTWEFVLPSETRAKYVKLHQNGSDGHYHLCEVEVYGTKEEVMNVALFKTAELSTTLVKGYRVYGANLAVDGVKGQQMDVSLSCFQTASGDVRPWWRIDLGDVYTILMIRIYNRMDCCSGRAHDITVLFWTTSDEKFELLLDGMIRDIHNFYTNIVARYLELLLSDYGPFHLCEVEVYGKIAQCKFNPCKNGGSCSVLYCDGSDCRDYMCYCPTGYGGIDCTVCVENVAIGKDIIVSSTRYSSWLPGNVIDGDTNQYVVNGATCVSTQRETNPYLIIDLGAEYTLSSVKVYKRHDCCTDDVIAVQLFLMVKTWTSYENTYDSTEFISKFTLNPFVSTRLVRLQAKGQQSMVMQLCEIEVFAVCQEELTSNISIIKDKPKPFMQMRFSLSDNYNAVVKSEDSFIHTIRQELSIYTSFSVESFKNVQLEKDPFRVSFELHSTDGNLRTLSAMLEKVDNLFKQGISDMKTDDGQQLKIIAGSLQYYVMYIGNTGTMLNRPLFTVVCMFMTLITHV